MVRAVVFLVALLAAVATCRPHHGSIHSFEGQSHKQQRHAGDRLASKVEIPEEVMETFRFFSANPETEDPSVKATVFEYTQMAMAAMPHPNAQQIEIIERSMGMWVEDVKNLQAYCDENKVTLVARRAEYDTVRLIKEGFAPKGLDVHAKSSNWGPMAGCVTLDPALSKKLKGSPDVNIVAAQQHDIVHHRHVDQGLGAKSAWQATGVGITVLHVTPSLLAQLSVTPCCAAADDCGVCPTGSVCYRDTDTANAKKQAMRFCVADDGAVSWVLSDNPGSVTPVYVWSYDTNEPSDALGCVSTDGKPVTGDYDLWLVGIHMFSPVLKKHPLVNVKYTELKGGRQRRKHGVSVGTGKEVEQDVSIKTLQQLAWMHPVDVPGGSATASDAEAAVVAQLNEAVGSKRSPPFMHTSEMWNAEFVQPIPQYFAVISPSDMANLVDMRTGLLGFSDGSTMAMAMMNLIMNHYLFPINENYFADVKRIQTQNPFFDLADRQRFTQMATMFDEMVLAVVAKDYWDETSFDGLYMMLVSALQAWVSAHDEDVVAGLSEEVLLPLWEKIIEFDPARTGKAVEFAGSKMQKAGQKAMHDVVRRHSLSNRGGYRPRGSAAAMGIASDVEAALRRASVQIQGKKPM